MIWYFHDEFSNSITTKVHEFIYNDLLVVYMKGETYRNRIKIYIIFKQSHLSTKHWNIGLFVSQKCSIYFIKQLFVHSLCRINVFYVQKKTYSFLLRLNRKLFWNIYTISTNSYFLNQLESSLSFFTILKSRYCLLDEILFNIILFCIKYNVPKILKS